MEGKTASALDFLEMFEMRSQTSKSWLVSDVNVVVSNAEELEFRAVEERINDALNAAIIQSVVANAQVLELVPR
eukprot:m.108602 g.108602  ORF g.108602 m.108602 type:complete len:74 (-) comp51743_c0_seq3:405-626(-)